MSEQQSVQLGGLAHGEIACHTAAGQGAGSRSSHRDSVLFVAPKLCRPLCVCCCFEVSSAAALPPCAMQWAAGQQAT